MANKIQGLYYLAPIENLPSILERGILSHNQVETLELDYKSIYDETIVNHRAKKKTPENKDLWRYANFYFQPRNAMLYKVTREFKPQEIVVIKLKKTILDRKDIWVTDGNAASTRTVFNRPTKALLSSIAKQIDRQFWTDTDDAKRQMMAECLVPDFVEPTEIECIYISRNGQHRQRVRDLVDSSGLKNISVVIEPEFFFQPNAQWPLTRYVSLAQGDMFFSRMQTLTISVNTKGVMGKGLASRTRYQFPDVYVHYEDACRNKSLTTKTPVLYQRTKSLTAELAEGNVTEAVPHETWFLLFATKEHWKEQSKLDYIIDGMNYLAQKYKEWDIQSLALPALGCGLGGLTWGEVGPILCTVADQMKIPVCIYLPAETNIPNEQLTAEFLLKPSPRLL